MALQLGTFLTVDARAAARPLAEELLALGKGSEWRASTVRGGALAMVTVMQYPSARRQIEGRFTMNRSEILRALEWVDNAAREGDRDVLIKAKLALEEELTSKRTTVPHEEAYRTAFESFVRKHGREPLEDVPDEF